MPDKYKPRRAGRSPCEHELAAGQVQIKQEPNWGGSSLDEDEPTTHGTSRKRRANGEPGGRPSKSPRTKNSASKVADTPPKADTKEADDFAKQRVGRNLTRDRQGDVQTWTGKIEAPGDQSPIDPHFDVTKVSNPEQAVKVEKDDLRDYSNRFDVFCPAPDPYDDFKPAPLPECKRRNDRPAPTPASFKQRTIPELCCQGRTAIASTRGEKFNKTLVEGEVRRFFEDLLYRYPECRTLKRTTLPLLVGRQLEEAMQIVSRGVREEQEAEARVVAAEAIRKEREEVMGKRRKQLERRRKMGKTDRTLGNLGRHGH